MSRKLNVYLAGPIANTTDFIARFAQARLEVVQLGYQPVCPIELNGVDENSRKEDAENRLAYLRKDLHALIETDGIYLLRDWEFSQGARLEKLVADGLGLMILFQDEGERDGKRSSRNRGADTATAS